MDITPPVGTLEDPEHDATMRRTTVTDGYIFNGKVNFKDMDANAFIVTDKLADSYIT